jgi:hypothetical protein
MLLNTIRFSERLSLLLFRSYSCVGTTVSGWGHFQNFRPDSDFGTYDRHGHFTLKQLRLPVLNETHTNSYTGPRLTRKGITFNVLKCSSIDSSFAAPR